MKSKKKACAQMKKRKAKKAKVCKKAQAPKPDPGNQENPAEALVDEPPKYVPGKFRAARLEWIREAVKEQGVNWREACQLWHTSTRKAELLQGMSKAELSKRRFNL